MATLNVGDVLHAPDGSGAAIQLVGIQNLEWVAAPVGESFGTPFRISSAELRDAWNVQDPSTPVDYESPEEQVKRDRTASDHAFREMLRHSPEAVRARERERKILAAGGDINRPPHPDSPEGKIRAAEENGTN